MSDAAHLRYLGTLVTFTDRLSAPRAFDVSARGQDERPDVHRRGDPSIAAGARVLV